MLLADCRARGVAKPLILCTQPRRIAAISLAKRVADELKEPLGRTVGFMIGADRVVGRDTCIRFVTTGWAFEKLIHADNFMEEVTHLVLDEVHERSIDADLLHLLIKLVLPKMAPEKRPKVVLMSATFNAGVFSDYYCPKDPPLPLYVGAKRYSVETFFLEGFRKCPALKAVTGAERLEINEQKRLGVGAQANMLFLQICRLLHEFHLAKQEPCCILVFLAGIAEIDVLWEHIEEMEERDGAVAELSDEQLSFEDDLADNIPKPAPAKKVLQRFQLCMLHSSVDKEDQMTIFTDIPVGKTRIILSTNIAESSVTIPNARYVIDAGFHKHMAYDERYGCTSLKTVPVSKAAAKQRAGRTGRLFPGIALRFFTERFYEEMPEYDEPDMLRLPLFNTVLRLKVAAQDESGFSSPLARPSDALKHAIDPPSHVQISNAYNELFRHGHMVAGTTDDLDDSIVTPLGKFLQKLNVDIRLGSLVVTALVLFPDYLPHAIVMAVSMSLQNIFVHANSRTGGTSYANQREFFTLLSKTEKQRMTFNSDLFSDAFTTLRAFGSIPSSNNNNAWLFDHGLHHTRVHQLQSQALELAQRLAPLVPAHIAKDLQQLLAKNHRFVIKEHDARILRFIMCYSLSDALMAGTLLVKENELSRPEKVGFEKKNAPYADWQCCVFFKGVPQTLLEMGGLFEKNLLNPLFVTTHDMKYKLHVGATNRKGGEFASAVAVEFATPRDAMFAQVVIEACCKNGKLALWVSGDEKVTIPAPLARTSLKLEVVNHGAGAKIGGTSATSYIQESGPHFFLPGQTIFVQNTVIVEDVTWLPGSQKWVWSSIALTPNSHVESPTNVGVGGSRELDFDFEEERLQQLVYLKHQAAAATSTQFSPAGRYDLGAEICRSVLDVEPSTVLAPLLKKKNIKAAKVQPTQSHKATVIMISNVDGSVDAKMNVKELKLKSVLAVAAAKVLTCEVARATVRLAKTGRLLSTDELLAECLAKDADAFGILRLEAVQKGMLVVSAKPHVPTPASKPEEEDGDEVEEIEGAPAVLPSRLSMAGKMQKDTESDEWVVRQIVQVLKMHADGRMKGTELVPVLKMASKQPERINLLRLTDVAHTSQGMIEVSRKVFCLGSRVDEERSQSGGRFVFESHGEESSEVADETGASSPAANIFGGYANVVKTAAATAAAAAEPESPQPHYTGVTPLPAKKKTDPKKGGHRAGSRGRDLK